MEQSKDATNFYRLGKNILKSGLTMDQPVSSSEPESPKAKPFENIIATYGYEVDGVVVSREAAQQAVDQAPGKIIDNTSGLGSTKKWRVLSARLEEREEGKGVVIASCVAAEE